MNQEPVNDMRLDDSDAKNKGTITSPKMPKDSGGDTSLRELIKKQVESFARDAVAASKTARGFAYGNQLDQIYKLVDRYGQEIAREARESERKLLTWQKLDQKILGIDPLTVEFEVTMKTTCDVPHYCIFASGKDGWGVAMDGQNVISKAKSELTQQPPEGGEQ